MATTSYTITVTAAQEQALEWLASQNNTTATLLIQSQADTFLTRLVGDYKKTIIAAIQAKLDDATPATIADIATTLGVL